MLCTIICYLLFMISTVVLGQSFPDDFIFGAATAAYQVEGAYNKGGRGMTVWDTFSLIPGKVAGDDNGEHADDQYHKYAEDVGLMKELGIQSYRFSIAWSRILPTGRLPVNEEGVEYYHNLLDALEEADIIPFVTLYHWDTPAELEKEYDSWLSETIVEDFRNYADVCFQYFGHRVKNWLTLNEPWSVTALGYGAGINAPGRCSNRNVCAKGNSYTEPYIAGRNLLLAHAAAVKDYRDKYQAVQGGQIGLTLNMEYAEPLTDSEQDALAAEQRREFQFGWFGDPVVFGDYPESMKRLLGDRLTAFSAEEKEALKGSYDFIGLNNYATYYVEYKPLSLTGAGYGWWDWWDSESRCLTEKDGKPIGLVADSDWLTVVPQGIRESINWAYKRYGAPIYVTENGCDVPNESSLPIKKALQDNFRISYLKQYIGNVSLAIQDGSDVKGYFVWSLLDNFEWHDGYSKRFGIIYVDYDDYTRHPKDSFYWYRNYIAKQKKLPLQKIDLKPHARDITSSTGMTAFYVIIMGVVAAVIAVVGAIKYPSKLSKKFRDIQHCHNGYTDMNEGQQKSTTVRINCRFPLEEDQTIVPDTLNI